MLTLFNPDKKLESLGFVKKEDNFYGAIYIRPRKEGQKYNHEIAIYHKHNGRHLIMSYQSDVNGECFNNTVGLTATETFALLCKYLHLKFKYHW